MADPIIQIEKLTKRFGDFTALKRCELSIEQGEVFGLLGPNGAGKSTLLRLVMGFIRPTEGRASLKGLDCYRQRVAVHQQVAYLPGDARLPKTMRGKAVLSFFSGLAGEDTLQRSFEIAERLDLDLSRWVAFMSTGMRQKLALSIALASQKPVLILDEPTANLDPTVRGEVLKIVTEAKTAGRTVVFSSHVLSEIEEVCDRAGILRAGELVHLQNMSELMRQHRIRATLDGELPPVPDALREDLLTEHSGDGQLRLETPKDLSFVLKWLADAPVSDVFIQPVGLRAIYDRFHSDAEKPPV